MSNGQRPFGVTLLGILYILQGLMWLVLPFVVTVMLAGFIGDEIAGIDFAALSLICWIPFIIIAVFYFLVAFGLFAGRGWARLIAIILAILGLLNFPIGTIISIIILIYLFRADVKAYFN